MKYNKLIFLMLILTFISIFYGCNKNSKDDSGSVKGDYPVTVSEVTINSSPKSVVVLSDSLADIVLAQGHEIKLSGRTDNCTQQELSVLPTVGTIEKLNIDKIKEINPDIIIASTALKTEQVQALSNDNTKIIVIDPAKTREEFESIYSNIGKIMAGNITGTENAKKVSQNILLTLDDITRLTKKDNIITTAVYLYDSEGKVAGGDTFVGKMIEFAGAVNIANDWLGQKMDVDAIKLSNPDFIFCATGMKDSIKSHEILSNLDAVKKGKIYEIEPNLLNRQGRSVISNVSSMAAIMFPEIANDGSSNDLSSSNNTNSSINSESSTTSQSSENSSESSSTNTSSLTIDIKSGMVIKLGDKSGDVLTMQKRLDELNYMHVSPSGEFTSSTMQAVKDFQFLNGLVVTGTANEETLKLLFSDKAALRKDPARQK